jgi:hypothetical protein
MLRIAEQIEFTVDVLLSYPLAVFLLQALMHEFARISQAIIHEAVKWIKPSDHSRK